MHIFYTPGIGFAKEYTTLNEEESRHCIKVLRLQTGNVIYLTDGRGGFFDAEIINPDPKKTLLKLIKFTPEFGKRNHYLHIAVAPTKNIERFEWFLEKATEIGIDEITPVICERSERRELKLERLNKVIVSAAKQSVKAYYPKLNDVINLKSFLNEDVEGQKFIAHCMHVPKESLKAAYKAGGKYRILIGPEGDFSEAEIGNAAKAGFVAITLGNSRLRTETAALEACFEINFLNR